MSAVMLRLLASPIDRAWLLGALARGLGPAEVIVKSIDTYRASGKITLQIPLDPTAQVLLAEPPRLQPGGITEIISYVRVRDRTFRDVTLAHAQTQRDVTVELAPLPPPHDP